MITSQEIREKTFEKAVIGGYDMGSVDNFMDELAEDFALLQKENSTLRSKMKVLAGSVEEYRSNEDALRMALISAQKLSVAIEKEARERSERILNEATAEAERIVSDVGLQAELESARLREAQRTTVKSIESMTLLCQNQLETLKNIAETPIIREAAAQEGTATSTVNEIMRRLQPDTSSDDVHETVKTIEETVAKAAATPVLDVKPEFTPTPPEADEAPTKAFDIVTDPTDDTSDNMFLFDNFGGK